MLETLVEGHNQEIRTLQTEVTSNNESHRRFRQGHNELQGKIEMVSDSSEQVRFGLVHIGGYTRFGAVQPEDRRRM